jgi:hypothetical protein
MSKRILLLSVTTIVILVPIKIAIAQSNSLCYMEDNKSNIIDLSKICGKSPKPNPKKQPTAPSNNGIDGKPPTSPPSPINPNIQLVPNQTQKPPIILHTKPSPLWNQIPDLTTPLKQQPPIK